MRVHFDDLFAVSNGMIAPKVPIRINGAQLNPGAQVAVQGAMIGGVNLGSLIGKLLEVDYEGGIAVIKGHY